MTKKVDIFVAGNSKSGTTALCGYLGRHPDLALSRPKEPNFFASDLCHANPEGAFRQMTEAEYDACFPVGARLLADGSACYLYSKVAATAIARHNPDARIIVVFREPVDFLVSYHLQMLRNPASEGEVISDFAEALAAEPERRAGARIPHGCRVPQLLFYRERIKYAEHLQRFLDVFPKEQVRVYLYDDFRNDNHGVVADAFRFLELEPPAALKREEVNAAVRIKSPRLFRALQDLAHGRKYFAPLKRAGKAILPEVMRRAAMQSAQRALGSAEKGTVPDELRRRLKAEFREEVEAFGDLTGRDVAALWGYTPASVRASERATTS